MNAPHIKRRSLYLFAICLILSVTFHLPQANAEELERSVTITSDQEWGQIIVESETSEFEVDVITPDGTKWTHTDETDEEVLFYYSFENVRHWVAEDLPFGTYQVIIHGPANAWYNVRNQNSYEHVQLDWVSPKEKTVLVTNEQATLTFSWNQTGTPLRGNSIHFLLQPQNGGEKIALSSATVSQQQATVHVPNALVDGKYNLFIEYDNNTLTPGSIDPSVLIDVQRGNPGDQLQIMEVAAAGNELYVDVQLPDNHFQTVEVAVSQANSPSAYQWSTVDKEDLTAQEDIRNRYSFYVPVAKDGTYQVAVRMRDYNGFPTATTLSTQSVDIHLRDWTNELITWSLEDGLTNLEYAELSVQVLEPATLMLTADGNTIWEEQLAPSSDVWTLKLPLSEGEHTYELYLYDKYGNYVTEGRIWNVDHTAPRLEMSSPLPAHDKILDKLVSGWTEPSATVTINKHSVEVDEHGYFQLETTASSVHIVVADESGNETVYEWSHENRNSSGSGNTPWGLLISGIVVLLGAGGAFFFKFRA